MQSEIAARGQLVKQRLTVTCRIEQISSVNPEIERRRVGEPYSGLLIRPQTAKGARELG